MRLNMIRQSLIELVNSRLRAISERPLSEEETDRIARLGSWLTLARAVDNRMGEHCRTLADEIASLALELRKKQEAQRYELATRDRRSPELDARAEALSCLIRLQAQEELRVQVFRERHLSAVLLQEAEVVAWVKERSEEEGVPTQFALLPLPRDCQVSVGEDGAVTFSPPVTITNLSGGRIEVQARMLTYAGPADTRPRRIAVAQGGVLDELRSLSEHLAKRYHWDAAQATIFVLTSLEPRVSISSRSIERRYPLSALDRITLVLDPALTDDQVRHIYKAAKQELVGKSRRNKPIGRKAMVMAVFSRQRRSELSWQQIMDEWNEAAPEHRYTERRRFEKECTDALQRLLRPERADDELARHARAAGTTITDIERRTTQEVPPDR
jgi:hypothetical protein